MANPHPVPRLENLKPFGKNNNANPAGAPKYRIFKDLAKELLQETNEVTHKGNRTLLTNHEIIIRGLVKRAANGDVRASDALYNRIEGKPIERISVTSTHEDQLLALSDEEKSEVFLQLKELQREHGILDTVELEVFEELERKHAQLLEYCAGLELKLQLQGDKLLGHGIE